MTTEEKRSGPGRGQGRKPKSASGELMKSRPMRMTDAQWDDVKFVGLDDIRNWVTKEAKRRRLHPAIKIQEITGSIRLGQVVTGHPDGPLTIVASSSKLGNDGEST